MKIDTIIQLSEMSDSDLKSLVYNITKFLERKGFRFGLRQHAIVDRLGSNEKTRGDVKPDDVLNTIKALFNNKKFLTHDFNREQFEGIVTNYNTNLNIVFYIGRREFRLITVKVRDDYKSDNHDGTKRFGVKV